MRRRALLVALALVPGAVRGHPTGLSSAVLEVDGDHVGVVLRASAAELETMVGVPPADVLGTMSVVQEGVACAFIPGGNVAEPPDGVRGEASFRCPSVIERVRVTAGHIERLPRGHTLVAEVQVDGRRAEHVLRAGGATFEVAGPPRPWTAAGRFLVLGVEHIFTGLDHVAFLLGLLLLGGTLRSLAGVVTSFTVAHSVTLGLAALGLVSLPPRIVEPLIAASVVVVAVENLRALGPGVHRPPRRVLLAFGFGLVHGFGFAGLLRDIGLPRGRILESLLAFNLGVELGQLAIVLAVVPLLALLRRRPAFALAGARVASVAIGVAGVGWLAERVLGA